MVASDVLGGKRYKRCWKGHAINDTAEGRVLGQSRNGIERFVTMEKDSRSRLFVAAVMLLKGER